MNTLKLTDEELEMLKTLFLLDWDRVGYDEDQQALLEQIEEKINQL